MQFNSIIRFVVLGLGFLLAGCIDSEAPLSDPEKSKPDEKVLGKWIYEEKGASQGQITIEKVGAAGFPPGIMTLTMRPRTRSAISKVGFVFSSELKGKTYLNVFGRMVDAPAKIPTWNQVRAGGFSILKYAVKEDTLTFWVVDDESPLKTAVKNGRLKGTIRPRGYLDFEPTVKLKDTSANVAQIVLREDEKLFSERMKMVLTRTK